MEVLINGETRQIADGATMSTLVDALGLAGQRIAVEVNREIVPRSTYAEHALRPGDRIEIVRAIGGG
jgi:thiamine biosynthesis protein ThiS